MSVAYVDDNDLMMNRKEVNNKMQLLLNVYNKLYRVTGGYIEDQKTNYYRWKWHWKQGEKVMKRIKIELWLNEKRLNEIIHTESVKSLGIYINPALK